MVGLRPHMQRHHGLFQAGVASPLADPVDRHFDLAGAVLDPSKRIGGRQPQIVVAVAGEDDLLPARRIFAQMADQGTIFFWGRVADGVWDVEGGCAGLDGDGEHLDQESRVAAPAILRAEFDVGAEAARIVHHVADSLQHLVARHAQLVLHVDVAGRQEGVDARAHRSLDRFPGLVDVVLVGTGQPGDHRRCTPCAAFVAPRAPPDRVGDPFDRLQVSWARSRKPCLHDIDAEPGQLAGDLQLFLGVERGTRALFAVPQRGVKDQHGAAVGDGARVGRRVVNTEHFHVYRRNFVAAPLLFCFNNGRVAHGFPLPNCRHP